MKNILKNWRNYKLLSERINTLEPDSGKRFICDVLQEIEEKDHEIPIPSTELDKIKDLAKLKGKSNYLGSGTKGSAYRFGDKVLKFTRDGAEAQAAMKMVGKPHPNVYDIFSVYKRDDQDMEKSGGIFDTLPYVITYEFLEYPNRMMLEPVSHMSSIVAAHKADKYYNWDPSYLDLAREGLLEMSQALSKDPGIGGEPLGKYQHLLIRERISDIGDKLGWSEDKKQSVITFYAYGLDSMSPAIFNDPQKLSEYVEKNLYNKNHLYFHQLALGMTHLFDNGVEFTDLKKSNIMEKGGQIAIIDIGYSAVKGYEEIPSIS